mgnify:CR=1 FL=1
MTFFGSTANDAAFNAYVTDTVSNAQRGRVESVLAILPLVSMLIIFGGFDGMTQAGNWQMFFLIFGALVTLTGVASLFLLKEQPATPKREPFFQQLAYGFRPSVIARHRALYLSLLAMCVFSIAVQVFFPYLIIYMQHYLLLDNYALVLGVVLIVNPFGAMETLVMAIGIILIVEGAINLLSALYTVLAVRRFTKLHPETQSMLEAITGQDLNGDGVIAPDVSHADVESTAVELDYVDESAEVEQEEE